MNSFKKFLSEHKYCIIVGVIIFVIMLLIMIIIGTTSKAAERFASKNKLPWAAKSEHLFNGFNGDLTPAESAIYNRLSNADPMSSSNIRAEYLSNKQEVPTLVSKLYS